MAINVQQAISRIDRAFAAIGHANSQSLLPQSLNHGKVYEVLVLAEVISQLRQNENVICRLVSGSRMLRLRSGQGPIDKSYSYIELHRGGQLIGEVFTDIRFSCLSYFRQFQHAGNFPQPNSGEFHELDIVVVAPGARTHPLPYEILLGVECKDTPATKSILRQALGIRRELSYLSNLQPSLAFSQWPCASIPADPPVPYSLYCTDPQIGRFSTPGSVFGITFEYFT